jgi:hypothetical protein
MDGTPTEYFIRWAQQRQIDIGDGITAAQALQIIQQYMDDHVLTAGTGISLSPSGNIGDNITIAAEVQAILDEITTTRGSILYRGAAGWAGLPPGTAGNFLKTNGAGADPAWAAASGGGGGGFFSVNTGPLAAMTTWVNQGTSTKTVQADGTITLVSALDGADNVRGVFMPLPATPWSYKIGFMPTLVGASFQDCGVALRDSVSGKMVLFAAYRETVGSSILWFIANYNSPTSKNANVLVPSSPTWNFQPTYLSIADDGVNRTAKFGFDPYFQSMASYNVAHNSFLVPDQIGVFTQNFNATIYSAISVFSWV